ncbi:DUF4091 domain-containing protein [Clostridium sp. KNHs214]|uniref:DUF4091 domain-containing protein n=1 Tax=Clostridium sp. KNHs214 TaxID=1540257 RepID=UPI0005559292|nr:DUF4091 domain-containing protein [Clostridium sp. KNHs214]
MNVQYVFLNSSFKHIKDETPKEIWEEKGFKKPVNLNVIKEEKFAFCIMIKADEDFVCSLDMNNNIGHLGLINRVRFSLECLKINNQDYKESSNKIEEDFSIHFIGYVKDDNGKLVGDAILRENYTVVKKDEERLLWVQGKVPKNYIGEKFLINLNMYLQSQYLEEEKIANEIISINVTDMLLKPLKKEYFHLDLWQHLRSLSTYYKVPLWSEEHFIIIKNYTKELASLGQKTITAVVSDFPWAGQGCYKVKEKQANLFESNLVKVKKDQYGNLNCDFSILDRYIELCIEQGIEEEIDLFGLLGNWDAMSFGNPLKDYKDPIRISYLNEDTGSFKYIDSKEELGVYIKLLLEHFIEKGWWSKVRIISDEPNNPQIAKQCKEFISGLVPEYEVFYKVALHDMKFLKEYAHAFHDISLSLPLTIQSINSLSLREKNKGKCTYYVCCFPDKLNSFLSSPLIESRLIGWYAYYFKMDGFLRWAYVLWPFKPFEDASYKHPVWKAGDMFFLYPGSDLKPISSVRWENLRFGLQDYQKLMMIQDNFKSLNRISEMEKDLGHKIQDELSELLGNKEEMKSPDDRTVEMNYSLNLQDYTNFFEKFLK